MGADRLNKIKKQGLNLSALVKSIGSQLLLIIIIIINSKWGPIDTIFAHLFYTNCLIFKVQMKKFLHTFLYNLIITQKFF